MSDFTYQGEDFEEKVRKQVEFYFSDSNLQTDKFLYKIYEANDGWVELKTLMTFGRMRQFRPEEKVIAALKNSEKLVLSANDELISRKDPLKDLNELKTIRKRNTVHIEGFLTNYHKKKLKLGSTIRSDQFYQRKRLVPSTLSEESEPDKIRNSSVLLMLNSRLLKTLNSF